MLCAMWPGDLVAVRRQGMGKIRRGHVVLFVRDGRFFRPQGGWEDPPAGPHAAGHARRPAEGKRSARFTAGAARPRYRRHSRQQVSGPAFHVLAPYRVLAAVPLGAGHTDGAAAWPSVEIHVGRTCPPRVQASLCGAPERASARDRYF